ncbi:MAG: hypothetical protein MRZ79_22295 [Bacteroidia bacterium]|nr:hypothetical protein [Bacteroidia bacterium]
MMPRIFVLTSLLFFTLFSFAGSPGTSSNPSSESSLKLQQKENKKLLRAQKKLARKLRKDDSPKTIFGFEPFTIIGLGLLAGGFFLPILLPLGILSLVFGFVRYKKLKPDTFKGQAYHEKIFIIGLLVPILAFVGIYMVQGGV